MSGRASVRSGSGWPIEIAIAWRYLRARRRGALISVISAIATLGVCLGVMALIIVIAVMAGMESDLRQKILGANAHVVVYKRNLKPIGDWLDIRTQVSTHQDLKTVEPFVFGKVMVRSAHAVEGVVVKGFDPMSTSARDRMSEILTSGTLPPSSGAEAGEQVSEPEQRKRAPAYVGEELAFHLGVAEGDQITLVSPFGQSTPGGMVPKSEAFDVAGIFHTGMYEYDSSWVYLPLEASQRFFGMKESVSGLEMFVRDYLEARTVRDDIATLLGPSYYVQDWMDMNENFFAALKLEKIAMFIILVLIVIVAAFNIVGTLTMMVMEKSKDIGILQAMGATRRSILAIFLCQGMAIGFVGTFVGAAVGATVCWVADTYQLIRLSGSVYYITHLPFHLTPLDVVLIVGSALAISFLATIYPAWQASRLDPVEAIRYE